MDIKARPAKPQDLDALQTLFAETIRSTCKNDYGDEQIDAWTSSVKNKERWKGVLRNQFFLVAELGGQIVGFGSLDKGNYLDFLYVHKAYLRRGIASLLFGELKKESERLGHHKLTANVSKTARPFFEAKGFRVLRENKNNINGVEIINYHMSQ